MTTEKRPGLWQSLSGAHPGELPALDIVRAAAILMVFAYHAWTSTRTAVPTVAQAVDNLLLNGKSGVTLFFVLSGYLITSVLMREYATSANISLSQFYLKRSLRILPAYYAYLIFFLILAVIGSHTFAKGTENQFQRGWYFDFLFVSNIWQGFHVHTWSLATEEQFYLLFPVLAIALFRASKRIRIAIILALYLVPLAIRVVAFSKMEPALYGDWAYHRPWTRFDDLLAGILVASAEISTMRAIYRRTILVVCSVAALSVLATSPSEFTWISPFLNNGLNLSFAGIVLAAQASPLKRAPVFFTVTARLSYSFYLWHMLAGGIGAAVVFHSVKPGDTVTWMKFARGILSAAFWSYVIALVSYRLIEMPFLRLRAPLLLRMQKKSST